jgi:hypothetical protein
MSSLEDKMSKIVQAVNAMLQKKELISQVIPGEPGTFREYFFLFNQKYKWSIMYNASDDIYYLSFYSTDAPLKLLASYPPPELEKFTSMIYTTQEIGTKEAYQTFRDLYTTIKEKVFGIDKVLDDIIEPEIPF